MAAIFTPKIAPRLCQNQSQRIYNRKIFWRAIPSDPHRRSRSANGSIRTIIEKIENGYVMIFLLLISITMASGRFAKSTSKKAAAAGAWFVSSFIDLYISTIHIP